MYSSKLNECGLVKTKYAMPRVSPYVFSRPRLHNKLNSALNQKLTLITAPVGYGKTTAVYEWLSAVKVPSAWFTVDENDNNAIIFWKYVFAALDQVAPGLRADAEYLFSSQELLKANIPLNTLINRLAELDKDVVLVIDDLHLIKDETILEGLSYLVRYMPRRMHLILVGREMPQLALAQDELRSQVLKLGIEALEFKKGDILQFFDLRGRHFEPEQIKQIQEYTAGWPAALVALAMSLENSPDGQLNRSLAACMGNCWSCIESYLLEEVVNAYSEEKRDFLYKASILDCLCMDLCREVTGNPNGEKIIEEMNQKNEFIMSYDEDRCMYRFNTIFKEILYKELIRSRFYLLPALYEKAALWCEREGLPMKAISYYIRGNKYKEAAELIEGQLMVLAAKNEYDLGITYIEQLPKAYRDQSVRISGFYTMYYAERNQLEEATQWSEKTEALADGFQNPPASTAAKTLAKMTQAYLFIRQGETAALKPLFDNMDHESHLFRSLNQPFDFNRTELYFSRSPIQRIAELYDVGGEGFGKFESALRAVLPYDSGYLSLAAGEKFYELNLLDEALPHLLRAFETGSQAKCPGVLVPAMVSIARVRRARKDRAGMVQALDQCMYALKPIGQMHWNYQLDAFKMRQKIEDGEMATVEVWIKGNKLEVYNEINVATEFQMIVYARALLALGLLEDAEVLLLRLLAFTERENRPHSRVEVLILLAMLFKEKAQLIKSANFMVVALEISLKEGYRRSLLDEGEGLIQVLKETMIEVRKREESSTVLLESAKDILEALYSEHSGVVPARAGDKIAEIRTLLTPKEMEVLSLIIAAHSNPEIADRLHIGLRTVKTHTANIYSKLGVANRSQCIRYVNELHLFEANNQLSN